MSSTSDYDSIAKDWVRDAQHLWQVQESLLHNYRTYLIVLNSLLAAGSCTIMVRLYAEIGNPPDAHSAKFFLIVIMILLLASFIAFAFGSIRLMGRVISNRGRNVHLCQYVIMRIQLGQFFHDAFKKRIPEQLAEMSLLSAFKTVEHPGQPGESFVATDENHARLSGFLWSVKNGECEEFNKRDFTRRNIYRLLIVMFNVIWVWISLFWVAAAGWLLTHTSFYCLLHSCPAGD